jgi:hypothetical protein
MKRGVADRRPFGNPGGLNRESWLCNNSRSSRRACHGFALAPSRFVGRLLSPLARRTPKDQQRGPRTYSPDEPREFHDDLAGLHPGPSRGAGGDGFLLGGGPHPAWTGNLLCGVFIHLASRRVEIAGIATHPTEQWMQREIGGTGIHRAFFFQTRQCSSRCAGAPPSQNARRCVQPGGRPAPRRGRPFCSMKRGVILRGPRGPRLAGRNPTRPLRSKSLFAL